MQTKLMYLTRFGIPENCNSTDYVTLPMSSVALLYLFKTMKM